MIVVIDEAGDGAFEVTGKIVVFEQDAAFQREAPALDFRDVVLIIPVLGTGATKEYLAISDMLDL